jgi:hypothetical protein
MSDARKIGLIIVVAIFGTVAVLLIARFNKRRMITLKGAVITRNEDPRKQLPIAGVEIAAFDGFTITKSKSDSSGLFAIKLRKRILRGQTVTLRFRDPGYEPFDLDLKDLSAQLSDQIHVAALVPTVRHPPEDENRPRLTISNLLVRYSIKTATVMTVGSAARSFEAVNAGNVPCANHLPCSPDGKWKASVATASLDAGAGNEFRNARASCIAGPCPFTRIDTSGLEHDGRTLSVSATTWSDTATFLVEAEVVHPMVSDVVRNSYPVIFGDALNFTLPPAAEGVSIQADLNGETIVFPLGPALLLSWADCNARANPDQTRVYRCELKPGYRWLNGGA